MITKRVLNSEVEVVKGKMGIIAKLEGNLGNLGGCETGRKSDRRWVHRDFERWCLRMVTAVEITVLSSGRSDGEVKDEKGSECF